MARLVVFGSGQLARVVNEYLLHDSPHQVVAFTVDGEHLERPTLLGLPVVPFDDVQNAYPPDRHEMVIAVGYQRVNHLRADRFRQARQMGYRLPGYVSSGARVWRDVVIGENCLIFEGDVIQPHVIIGDDVIVGPGASIGHDSRIMDHAFVASHADVSGGVTVEPYAFLGANCTIRDGVRIASENVIGANVAILRSTRPREVFVSPRPQLLPLGSDQLPRI